MQELEPYGCWFDLSTESFLALSAPAAHVADHLAAEEAAGALEYETGRTGH